MQKQEEWLKNYKVKKLVKSDYQLGKDISGTVLLDNPVITPLDKYNSGQ